jgi:site-specific DNA-methyltransferase (adenine-specific)
VPKYVKGSDTSKAAAKKVNKAAAQRERVFEVIKYAQHGLTDEEIQTVTGYAANSQRPRRVELVEAGRVLDSGIRRKTRSGRKAVVWASNKMKKKKPVKKKRKPKKAKLTEPRWNMYQGDCLDKMRDIPDASVHCVVTSPPYWALRDYDVEGQHGLEQDLETWLDKMVEVFNEVWRVLRDDGTLWINIGDNYIDGDLQGQPWELALALKADGWILRSDCVWNKPNPTPEPGGRRRPTLAHEYIFQFTKTKDYFYDEEAIKEQGKSPVPRAKRTVWEIPAGGAGEEGHFAAFPEELPEVCIKASTSEHGCCVVCGAQYKRKMELTEHGKKVLGKGWHDHDHSEVRLHRGQESGVPALKTALRKQVGWEPSCEHTGFERTPATVLDPYAGSGTSGLVALRLGRSFVGIELNPKWYDLARKKMLRGQSQGGRVTDEDLQTRAELGLMTGLEETLFNDT